MTAGDKIKTHQVPGPGAQETLAAAVQHFQAGRLVEARAAYRAILTANPRNIVAMHHLGVVEYQFGQVGDALRLLEKCVDLRPDYAQGHCDLGVILIQLGRDDEAIEASRKAVELSPGLAVAHSNLGDLMQRRGDAKAAEAAYGRAIKLLPGLAAAHAGRADALIALDRLGEARKACETALRLAPRLALAHGVMGLLLHREHRPDEAIAAYERALQLDPGLALVHTRLANVLREEGRLEEALQTNARALAADPACVTAWCNQALTLQALGHYEDAVEACSKALTVKTDFPDALASLGMLLQRVGDTDQAVRVLRRALDLAPEAVEIYASLGDVLKTQKRYEEALEVYQAMLRVRGDNPPAQGLYDFCNLRRQICDWEGLEGAERRAIDALKASGERRPPFGALAMSCAPRDHLELSRIWAGGFRSAATLASNAPPVRAAAGERRIRLGYLSADFYQHATATLMAELIERHDRDRFDVHAYCFSPDDNSLMRQRLIVAFDRFRVIEKMPHDEAARLIAGDSVDILIDLKGYTRNARTMILARRPAPIQVNYLGYPSTMGAPFIDYIIADPIIAPMEHQPFFDEKIVQLPGCYQPNDRQRQVAGPACGRAGHGLPDDAFVFCSFNNAYKITAPVFGVWMRLLDRVPGSVLWLLDANALAKENLRREAVARCIAPERLVFAPKIPNDEHLARYALADLFLDNLPVNAHTTASEALWSGLPVVTCLGDVFVGRVCASLLRACGLSELVTHSLEEYETLALRLATSGAELDAARGKLAEARMTAPLFDSESYARDLEAAFTHMMRLHEEGRPPEAFAVADISRAMGPDSLSA